MNTTQLEYMIALADHANMTEAAASLGISQSALSRSVAQLSEGLGIQLFTRGKSLALTPAGRRYVQNARRILAVKNQTYLLMHAAADPKADQINVGLAPHQDSSIVLQIFDRFQQQFPAVKLNITEGYSRELADLVGRGQLDISVGILNEDLMAENRIDFLPTQKLEHLVGIAESNTLAEGGAASAYDPNIPYIRISLLKDVPYIAPNAKAISSVHSERMFAEAGIVPLTVCTTCNSAFSKKMACNYNGWSFIPMDSCNANEGLRYFFLDSHMYVQKGFYLRRGLVIGEPLRKFMDMYTAQMLINMPLSAALYPYTPQEVIRGHV